MNKRVCGLAAFAAVVLCGNASAAVINYSAVIDLDPAMLHSSGLLMVPLPGGPIDIAVGDTLEGAITFAHGGRITILNGDLDGRERVSTTFSPDAGTTAFSEGSFKYLDVLGDYVGPEFITSLPFNGAVGFGRPANLTDTSFSFSGISFSITYVDNHGDGDFPLTSHVTPNFMLFPYETAQISESAAAPEPAIWATLTLGFALLGGAARRSREKASAQRR